MSRDTTSRHSTESLAPPAPAQPAAFLPCSDCRAPMQKHYYALDSRPICAKCRMGYEKRIACGRGAGSLGRMLVMGGGAALAGAAAVDPDADTADSLGIADLEDAQQELRVARVPEHPQSLEEQKAAQLRSGGVGQAILLAFVLFLTLPIVSAFGLWGLQAAAVSLVALGLALFKAWSWTSDGVSYQVSGPHRVGTGPIPATW